MIHDKSRYYSLNGSIPCGGPSTWHVIDWDRRRVVSVTMDGEQDDESIAVRHFRRYSDELSYDIYRIYLSDTGDIVTTYSDPQDDQTYCVHYPLLHEILLPEGIQTVRRDELEELERLGPDVDLVAYPPCLGESAKKVVLKYFFMWQYAEMSWKEMNLWMRLPRHPNIVPFHRVVVDELEGRVVGFTNDYVPGSNLEENKSRLFKLEWLKQLMQVVDDLNLVYGIAHQDIAPRNLVVDESTNSIMLFDFNFAARINHPAREGECHREVRNDVKGVIFTAYEIITRNNTVRSVPHERQNLDDLGKEWVKHPEVKLDAPVEGYQRLLQTWRERRAGNLHHTVHPGGFPTAIDLPPRPQPPKRIIPGTTLDGQPSSITVDKLFERRQDLWARGEKALNWERPPQRLLDNGVRVLSTGEVINC